jgi:hypothetical protein
MKIRPVEAELFRTGGRTDEQTGMMKLIVALRNFAKASRNWNQKTRFNDVTLQGFSDLVQLHQ